jgi:hypothetical protein
MILPRDRDSISSHNFYKLAAAAIACACNVTKLHIPKAPPLVNLLREVPLTHLRRCIIAYDATIGMFLRNRLNLRMLLVASTGDEPYSPVENFPSVHFPELVSFIGPADIAPYILANSHLQQLVRY